MIRPLAVVGAALVALAAATPTLASDALAPDYFAPSASDPSTYDWNGFYAGVIGSVADVNSYHTDIGFWMHGSTYEQRYGGLGIGATAGYNIQMDNIVYGIEGDISWLGASRTDFISNEVNWTTSMSALATLRGRVGLAIDSTLLYATAGVAAANLSYDWDEDSGEFFNKSGWNIGWVAGAGIEHAVTDSFSLKAEYLYTSIGSGEVLMDDGGPQDDFPFELGTTASVFRVGANYSF